MYTQIIIKKISHKHKTKILLNIRMIRMTNWSLNELKLIAQNRNKSDYENKPKKELVKAISEAKPKIRIIKKKSEEIKKDFVEFRHKFSKTEADKYRKVFYDIKNYRHIYDPNINDYRHLSESEIEKVRKHVNKF